jgi:uncharacterized protein involved in tolerance to divalent cations
MAANSKISLGFWWGKKFKKKKTVKKFIKTKMRLISHLTESINSTHHSPQLHVYLG